LKPVRITVTAAKGLYSKIGLLAFLEGRNNYIGLVAVAVSNPSSQPQWLGCTDDRLR
jgi:hypothetical protein